jgi:hypothetical protein
MGRNIGDKNKPGPVFDEVPDQIFAHVKPARNEAFKKLSKHQKIKLIEEALKKPAILKQFKPLATVFLSYDKKTDTYTELIKSEEAFKPGKPFILLDDVKQRFKGCTLTMVIFENFGEDHK